MLKNIRINSSEEENYADNINKSTCSYVGAFIIQKYWRNIYEFNM